MTRVRSLAIGLLLVFGLSSEASAHCTGQPAAGLICGNNAATSTFPDWFTMTSLLDRNFGAPSVQGTVLNRGASLWSATATPSLGKNGGTGGAITLNGSSTGSATIGVKAAAGSVTFNLPITNGTVNQVLITDGSGNTSWTTAGAGTVSSVGLSLPSIITVTGSPVTGAGTLTGTLATQSANLVWAGPTTGAASTPTFRSLVGADLPNPSSSSLGGVQSFAAVGSQWIRQISTLGVPTASQPAFTDISGTLAAAQCPNPSASTIGCVESYVAVPHQWINAISTAGVPSSTQPNFTDLSGSASLAQLPSISSSSVLGNNSGGTSIPSALSASNVLDFIATTQGDVLYRNASAWVALPPGTNGQVLTSGGAAANPTWTTVTGTGTVTSIATNNGITGGTITTTGTIGLATIATGNVLAYTGAGSGVPVATTPSTFLDVIGSTAGNILYRAAGGTGWQVLAPGTNGQVLTMGASTPAWGSAGSVSNVTITADAGLISSGTCTVTTTGTCTLTEAFDPGSITNCTLAVTAPGNALTVALKTQSGADPSSSSPCIVSFRSATAATGDYTAVSVTAATSVALGSTGSSLGSPSSATPFRVWVTAWNNAGTVVLGLSDQTGAGDIFPINEGTVQSSTACSGCTNATSAGVFYTTAAQTNKAIRILGYMDWASGLATAGTWNVLPTTIQMMGPGVKKPGDVIRRTFMSTNSPTSNSTTSYVASAVARNFTKTSSANPVRLDMSGSSVNNSGGTAGIQVQIYRGSAACTTSLPPIAYAGMVVSNTAAMAINWIDNPAASGTTSAQYTVCFASPNSVSVSFPYGPSTASFILEEVMG